MEEEAISESEYLDQMTVFGMRLTAARQAGDREREGMPLDNIGRLYHDQGDYEQALSYYEQHLAVCWVLRDKIGAGRTIDNIAR